MCEPGCKSKLWVQGNKVYPDIKCVVRILDVCKHQDGEYMQSVGGKSEEVLFLIMAVRCSAVPRFPVKVDMSAHEGKCK